MILICQHTSQDISKVSNIGASTMVKYRQQPGRVKILFTTEKVKTTSKEKKSTNVPGAMIHMYEFIKNNPKQTPDHIMGYTTSHISSIVTDKTELP